LDAVLFENVYKCDGAESFRREGFSSQRKRDVQELPHHRADDDHPALAALRHRQALANRLMCGRVSVQSCLETISITGLSLHRMPSTGPDEGAAELE
jgi:hypothetical protein